MADFLSDEWITALGRACSVPPGIPPAGEILLVVEPVVRGVPGRGDVRYRVAFEEVATSVSPSRPGIEPDVRLETDYPTAVALARGDLNAQAALAEGRLRVSGDVTRLAAHASALSRLADLFASVRAMTTYPGVEDRS